MAVAGLTEYKGFSRSFLYSITIATLLINGYTGQVLQIASQVGFTEGLYSVFEISVFELIAAFVALWRLLDSRDVQADWIDYIVSFLTFCVALLPDHRLCWGVLGIFATYLLLRANSISVRSAAIILSSLAVANFGGKLLLSLFAQPLVRFDAMATYALAKPFDLGLVVHHNTLITERDHTLVIMKGCSSVSNMSQALLAWAAIPRIFRPDFTAADWILAPCIALLVALINVVRMALMLVSEEWYLFFHYGYGGSAIDWLTFCVVSSISYMGGQRVG